MKLNAARRLKALTDQEADAFERELTNVKHSDPNVLVAPTLMVGNDTSDSSDPNMYPKVPQPFAILGQD